MLSSGLADDLPVHCQRSQVNWKGKSEFNDKTFTPLFLSNFGVKFTSAITGNKLQDLTIYIDPTISFKVILFILQVSTGYRDLTQTNMLTLNTNNAFTSMF